MRRALIVVAVVGCASCIPWDQAYEAWDSGVGGGVGGGAGGATGGGTGGGAGGDAGAARDSGVVDAGTPDGGAPDAGTDGGLDAGSDAGTDAGQVPVPTFTGIAPTASTADGGIQVIINGTSFLASDVPHIGGVPCTGHTYFNANAIGCIVPPVFAPKEFSTVGYGVMRDGGGSAQFYGSVGGFSYLGHPSLWLDANDPAALVLRPDGGPFVARWVDKSLHHNDVEQPADYLQPQVVSAPGGVKVLLFHASPNCGNAPYACGYQTYLERVEPDLPHDAGARTLLVAAAVLAPDAGDSRPDSSPVLYWGDGSWCAWNRSVALGFGPFSATAGVRPGVGFAARGIANDGGDVSGGAWAVLRYAYEGGPLGPDGLAINGTPVAGILTEDPSLVGQPLQTGGAIPLVTANCGGATQVWAPFVLEIGRVGQTFYGNDSLNGAIAAVFVYPRVLTAAEASVVEGWIKANYKLP